MSITRLCKWLAGAAVVLFIFVVFPNPHPPVRGRTSCLSNEKQIMLGMLMYAQDNDSHLPGSGAWHDAIYPYIRNKQIFDCPAAALNAGPDYAMASRWSGADPKGIPLSYQAVVLYEVAAGWPVLRHPFDETGRYDDWYSYLRSQVRPLGINLGYADGHCRWRSEFPSQVLTQGRDPDAPRARPRPSAFDEFRWKLRRLFFRHEERASRLRIIC